MLSEVSFISEIKRRMKRLFFCIIIAIPRHISLQSIKYTLPIQRYQWNWGVKLFTNIRNAGFLMYLALGNFWNFSFSLNMRDLPPIVKSISLLTTKRKSEKNLWRSRKSYVATAVGNTGVEESLSHLVWHYLDRLQSPSSMSEYWTPLPSLALFTPSLGYRPSYSRVFFLPFPCFIQSCLPPRFAYGFAASSFPSWISFWREA